MPVNTGITMGALQGAPQQRDPIQQLAALMQLMQAEKQGQLTDLELRQRQQAMPFQLAQLQAAADKEKRTTDWRSGLNKFMEPSYPAQPAPWESNPEHAGPGYAAGPPVLNLNKALDSAAVAGIEAPWLEKIADHRAKQAQAKASLEATKQAREDALLAHYYDMDRRSQEAQLNREQRAQAAAEAIEGRADLAKAVSGGRAQTTTIADPNNPSNTLIVNVNTFNEDKYRAGDRTGVIGQGPKLTQAGTSAFKQATQMQGFASDIQMAEDILMGQKRDQYGNVMPGNKPTGSLIGKGVDILGSVVGYAPPGAEEAAELKTVAARLVQRVPRFEGPQSDKDVAEYKNAAGQAANEGLPRETRLAAIRKMRELYTGYEDGSRGRLVQQQVQGQNQQSTTGPASKPYALKNSKGWNLMRDPVTGVRAYVGPNGQYEVVP